jgi:hypothetical protein
MLIKFKKINKVVAAIMIKMGRKRKNIFIITDSMMIKETIKLLLETILHIGMR